MWTLNTLHGTMINNNVIRAANANLNVDEVAVVAAAAARWAMWMRKMPLWDIDWCELTHRASAQRCRQLHFHWFIRNERYTLWVKGISFGASHWIAFNLQLIERPPSRLTLGRAISSTNEHYHTHTAYVVHCLTVWADQSGEPLFGEITNKLKWLTTWD